VILFLGIWNVSCYGSKYVVRNGTEYKKQADEEMRKENVIG